MIQLRRGIAALLMIMIVTGLVPTMMNDSFAQDSQSPLEPYSITTLDNGLDVIVKEAHTAPIVAVYLWCNTGSVNERPDEHGISHFYEHMFFKGTEKRGVGEIDRAIKSLGGYNNAFTSKEYTAYYVVLPSENFSLAADVLVDAIRHSSLPPEEIEKELGVIKEEINRKEDDPLGKLYEDIFKVIFEGTQYAHPVLGTKETISALTREDFLDYIHRFYVPNNMAAVVVGDVDTDEVVEEMRRLTADWEPDPAVTSHMAEVSVAVSDGVNEFAIEKDVNMSYVLMAFPTAGLTDLKENAALDVTSSLLGEGRSSRLYRRMVEQEQIASSVQAFIYPLTQAGLFVVYGTTEPDKVDTFKSVILEEIEKLHNESINDAELNKVKTMLKADFQFSNETDSDLGYSLGHYQLMNLLDHATQYEKTIEAVTAAQVQKYVQNTLNTDAYTMGVINPRAVDSMEEVHGE